MVLTLALGIGANTAIFSVVNAVLLRPLPYASGEQLVVLQQEAPAAGIESMGLSPLEVTDYRAASETLDGVVEYHSMNFTLLGGVEPQRVTTGVVSWNFFDVLGREAGAGPGLPRRATKDRGGRRPPAQPRLLAGASSAATPASSGAGSR